MNVFTRTMLAMSCLLSPLACSKDSQKQPEAPSQMQPASGTEPSEEVSPPGMSPQEQQGEELSPGAPHGPTEPGTQEPGMSPEHSGTPAEQYGPAPAGGGSGGSGGMGGGGGSMSR